MAVGRTYLSRPAAGAGTRATSLDALVVSVATTRPAAARDCNAWQVGAGSIAVEKRCQP